MQVSSSTQGLRRVWYKLVSAANGEAYKGVDVDGVTISTDALVLDFSDAVYTRNSPLLDRIGRLQLQVYGTESSFTKRNMIVPKIEPLHPASLIGSFGETHTNPMIVVVPCDLLPAVPESLSSSKEYYLYLSDENDIHRTQNSEVYLYADSARRIRADAEAQGFTDALWQRFKDGRDSKVFNALCVPSGTGKTQLAFALPEEQCTCIYLNMSLATPNEANRQPVYKAFTGYMVKFIEWLKEDYGRDNASGLRIYGFLKAVMKLLMKHPELRLPVDLSRLGISSEPQPGFEEEVIDLSHTNAIQSELVKLMAKSGRQLVIFIDEFAVSSFVNQEQLAFLRRNLMEIGACVIVASTDSGALNMLNTAAATGSSRGSDGPWVNLCTQLPKYVPTPQFREKIDICENTAVKTILELCMRSRPLFANAIATKVEEYLVRSTDQSFPDILEFLEDMRKELVDVLRTKKGASSHDGCYGYVMAILLAGGALMSGDEDYMRLFGNLSTQSWAYLVDDRAVLEMTGPSPSEAERKRLRKGSSLGGDDRFMRLSIRKTEPTSLFLWRENGISGLQDTLYLRGSNGERFKFSCTTFFPDPSDDFLLYLMLAGSEKQPGLYVSGNTGLLVRISVAKLLQLVFEWNTKLPPSVNDIAPSFGYHEALVCSAFFLACNAGSLHGCTLEELVTRLVSELIAPRMSHYPELGIVEKIPLDGDFIARFAFPFDTELPHIVYEALNAVQLSRPAKEQSVDAATYRPDCAGKICYQVLVEAKSTTKRGYVKERIQMALERQDSNAKVSFIVVDKNPDKDIRFQIDKTPVLNRSEKDGRKWALGEPLDARVFSVEVDESHKVFLRAIDGKSEGASAKHLIFVICLAEISLRFK